MSAVPLEVTLAKNVTQKFHQTGFQPSLFRLHQKIQPT
jgi:hypothetical protein